MKIMKKNSNVNKREINVLKGRLASELNLGVKDTNTLFQ